MQIVTYLGFTLLSIFIQFSVIDFIQGRLKLDEKEIGLKGTSQKKQLSEVLKNVSNKPHALYYRSQKDKEIKIHSPAKLFSNYTLTELFATTDMTSTVFDILYDETNTTGTEETLTTESLYTSTDIENVTEVTFFEFKNNTKIKTDIASKKTAPGDCGCNFLYKVCDINCCCDNDCSDSEIELFLNCGKNKTVTKKVYDHDDYCVGELQLPYFGYGNSLFCIVAVNLPEKRSLIHQKTEQAPTSYFMTWKSSGKLQVLYEFSNTIYKNGDPIWLLKNGTFYYTDLPLATVNNYCTGRKAIQFLKDEKYSCNVNKIRDLEMFQIMKSLEEVTVVSATPLSINSSVLNCTSLHCVNWTVFACSGLDCVNYNKSIHEPICTEIICTNLAYKIDYIFYYHESKIINATIKFHLENITMHLPSMSQEIQVKFVLGNETLDKILKLSGSPGYHDGLPIIVSHADKNYTDTFFNNTTNTKKHLVLPENYHGLCKRINSPINYILFGKNRRINCRYNHQSIKFDNFTEECRNIQSSIENLMEVNKKAVLSPLGNPLQLKDKDWIAIETSSSFQGVLHGRVQLQSSKLFCLNLITRYSIIFSFANMDGINRIMSCKLETTAKNFTFNIDDISAVVTIDISFIDVTKPSVIQHVPGPPNLNIHLPDDFFYPFRSNESHILKHNVFIMIFLYLITCK